MITLLLSGSVFSQNFRGTITNSNGESVDDCYILLINSATDEIINYVLPNHKGEYSIDIKADQALHHIKIRCQGMAYYPESKSFDIDKKTSTYRIDFKLTIRQNHLEEVVVVSDRVAIKIKNDTVEFDVSKHKKVDDKRIINVLKNMPGIQVNEKTGLIQYKGKPIETILLDGDDLFGKSYSVGAKNISADLVDKVEAIEDYHNNKLKKGIQKSDKVALNLKFKKNKFKTSGDVTGGGGKDLHIVNANTVHLSSDMKGLGVFNFNNFSLNDTPFQSEIYSRENQEEIDNSAIDFFRESSIAQTSISPRSYVNNLKYGSFTNLFKPSKNISVKTAVSFFKDRSEHSSLLINDLSIDGHTFQTSNETFNFVVPTFVQMANEANINVSKNAILKYSNRIVDNKNSFDQVNLQNGNRRFNTQIHQNKFYYQQNLNYTKRLSNNDLIEIDVFNSNDSRQQSMNMLNQESVVYDGTIFDGGVFKNEREVFLSNISYFKKIKNWNFEFASKGKLDVENFKTNAISSAYDYKFRNNQADFVAMINFQKSKGFRLKGKVDTGFSKRELMNNSNNIKMNQEDWLFNSDFQMTFQLNQHSRLSLNFENRNAMHDNYYLFSSPILVDSRTIVNNDISLNLEKKWKTYISFSHYNLVKQSNFSLLSSYEEIRNSIMSKQYITENISMITYFQTPQSRKKINLLASKGFFIDYINNKISLSGYADFNQYFNALNGSSINQVFSSVYGVNLEMNSAFEGFFNYKSSVGITYMESKQKNSYSFFNTTLNARLETNFRFTKKNYLKIESELLLPNKSTLNENQLFIDVSFVHKENNIDFFILCRNLLNRSSFNQIQITEFSRSFFSNNLTKRYIVAGLNYNF